MAGLLLGMNGWLGARAAGNGCSCSRARPPSCSASSCWRYLPDNPRDARWLTAEQRHWLAARIARGTIRRNRAARRRPSAALLHPTVWLLAFVMFACQTGSYGLNRLGAADREESLGGLSERRAWASISAIPYAAAAIGMVLIGAKLRSERRAFSAHRRAELRRSDRLRRERVPVVAGAGHDRADGRRGRRSRQPRAVLVAAGTLSGGQRSGRLHRVDQHRSVRSAVSSGHMRWGSSRTRRAISRVDCCCCRRCC